VAIAPRIIVVEVLLKVRCTVEDGRGNEGCRAFRQRMRGCGDEACTGDESCDEYTHLEHLLPVQC
jgi:hypothetical protein